MRDYQINAIRAILSGPHPGVGVIKMPTRSGKTKTAARLIKAIGLPTIFIVPSKLLLYQTVNALRESLPGTGVGIVGDSVYDPQFVTVATIQTLDRMRGRRRQKGRKGRPPDPRFKDLVKMFDVAIVDEAHHIRGDGDWYKVLYEIDARYKVGLSATVFPDSESEAERGIIWLKATCGCIRIDIPVSELVERGFLMRQNVRMYRITRPDMRGKRWSQTLRQRGITQNAHRNRVIVALAKRYAESGSKVLIVADRLDHIGLLSEALDDVAIDHRVITGKDSQDARESKIDGLVSGDYNLLIGTVMREGVDVPAVEVVINAEGGSDVKTTIQRQRNLTIAEGKTQAIFIDFYDETNEYFERHSRARLDAYRSESAFDVKLVSLKT